MESTVEWTVIGVGLALAGLILATTRGIRAEMRAQLDRMDKRLDELSVRVSRLEQSQAHTAGLIEGIRDSLFDRAGRVGADH